MNTPLANCKTFDNDLPELIADPNAPASVAAKAHLDTCAACRQQYASFQSTFSLLDTWQAPEPSPYFDRKLAVRLREEAVKPPAGWLERLRLHLLFNTGRQFRPALAGGLALVLLLGGGTFAGLTHISPNNQAYVSPTVDDLQILDKNDQAMQQMDQLLQDDGASEEGATQPLS